MGNMIFLLFFGKLKTEKYEKLQTNNYKGFLGFRGRWNHRNYKGNLFEKWLKNALLHEKELEYWKAQSTNHVKQIAYTK